MRVLVTRPRGQAEATARRLAELGHEALTAPLLTVVATGAPAPPGPFAALIVTSANAVPALGGLDKAFPVFAVGARTAALVGNAGFATVTAAADAEALAETILKAVPPGARLLHVAGRDHKPEPQASLEAAGLPFATWIAYEAVAERELPAALDAALRGGTLDAALHYSRRTAETALALARAAGLEEAFLRLAHSCLSEDVAAPLREQGAPRLIVADEPDQASLFAALALLS
ncbi:MAG TPA: uroporphyrinogen-III synthase [Beijerinckiaceae bacterium]|jgi:uroporphyrinogen-III synthase